MGKRIAWPCHTGQVVVNNFLSESKTKIKEDIIDPDTRRHLKLDCRWWGQSAQSLVLLGLAAVFNSLGAGILDSGCGLDNFPGVAGYKALKKADVFQEVWQDP